MDEIQKTLLMQVADLHEVPTGAYNIRANGEAAGRHSTEHIEIVPKEDKPGIDIFYQTWNKKESSAYSCINDTDWFERTGVQ